MSNFLDDKIAERLGGSSFGKSTAIYKFELIKRAKAAAKKAHPEIDLIDMGVGEPDWPADVALEEVVNIAFRGRLIETLDHPVIRRLRGGA